MQFLKEEIMDKKIVKIVLTGGPCGGKSTGLSYIERAMTKYGYKVVIINESATELMLNGLTLNAYNGNQRIFEKNIVKLQLLKEKLYYEACQNLPDEKILLVCDRGIMDCMSYVTKEDFMAIIDELGEDFIELRDNYDGVFHLVTCAKGAEECYTSANNSARTESVEEAVEADERTLACWAGHPHLRVVDNSTGFEEKLNRLIAEICSLLGEPVPMEIERKFLIKKPDTEFLSQLRNCKRVQIVQTYLVSDGDNEVRVRQRGEEGSYIYTLTQKKRLTPMKRVEIEQRITEKQYLNYLNNADTNLRQIRKDRYCLVENGKYFEIDIYPFAIKTAIMEVELSNENEEVVLPEFIEVIKEVTDDEKYSNFSLAKSEKNILE